MSTRPILAILHDGDLPPNLDALRRFADVRLATADTLAEALAGAGGEPPAEVLLLWDFFSGALRAAWSSAKGLEWIHVAAAGVDSLLFPELVDSSVAVTNARGIFDSPIAEFVLASVLAFAKQIPTSLQHQAERRWEHRETESIAGSRALVVGTGAIGRKTARLLRAAGLRVDGAARRAREGDPDFVVVHSSADLPGIVGGYDWVIGVAPLTDTTRALFDARVFAAMRPSARFINVGRGETAVTAALEDALEDGQIAGAALDVVDPEPLPAASSLWARENVLISPHLSGDSAGWQHRLAEQFAENLGYYVAGEPPHNVVDKRLGFGRG